MVEQWSHPVVSLARQCEQSPKLRKADMTIEHREKVAQSIAEEGIVLLKNTGTLSLNGNGKVLITAAGLYFPFFGGGSSRARRRGKYVNLYETLSQYVPNVVQSESTFTPSVHCCEIGNLKKNS